MKFNNNIIVLITLVLFVMCNSKTKAPERHANVPMEAIWYGGSDGGNWIIVDESTTNNHFKLRIYNDFTGELNRDEIFILNKACSELKFDADSICKYINAYDGERLILSVIREGKHCYLTPLKKAP